MWTRRAFGTALVSAALAPRALGVPTPSTTTSGRTAEVLALRRFAESTHPRGREARDDSRWRARWDGLARQADDLADGEFFVGVRRALGWFDDGHTTLLPFEFTGGVPPALSKGPFSWSLPLRLRAFDDGLYVVSARGDAAPLLGRRVERLENRSAPEIMRTVADDWPGNDAWAQRWAGACLSSPAQLHGFGIVPHAQAPLAITVAGNGGGTRSFAVTPGVDAASDLESVPRRPPEHETWAARAGSSNYVRPLGDGVLYASIDEMGDVDGMRFVELTQAILSAVEDARVRRLVIDLRRNGGGNNYFGEALRRGLARSRINRPGGLYVLVGPRTFSAAQNLANRLERETFARFTGTPTGGAPNHYGDASTHVGAATGITAIVSTLPWFDSYPQDTRPWIVPDDLVPDTYDDWAAGRDPALDRARTDDLESAPDELHRDRIFFFRRASQSQPWRPFWRT